MRLLYRYKHPLGVSAMVFGFDGNCYRSGAPVKPQFHNSACLCQAPFDRRGVILIVHTTN